MRRDHACLYRELDSIAVSSSLAVVRVGKLERAIRLIVRGLKKEIKSLHALRFIFGKDANELRKIQGSCRGRCCLVVGNGPSADSVNWDVVSEAQEIDVYCVNQFLENRGIDASKISGLLLSDKCSLDIEMARETNPAIVERVLRLQEAIARYNWPLFVPFEMKKLALGITGSSDRVKCFSDNTSVLSCSLSPLWPRRHVSMTVLKLLVLVGYMEYEQILLIGCDNDYTRWLRILPSNEVGNLERHSGSNASFLFKSMPLGYETFNGYLSSLIKLNKSWRRFSSKRVLNLDPLSFVDAFEKIRPGSVYMKILKKERQEEIRKLYKDLGEDKVIGGN